MNPRNIHAALESLRNCNSVEVSTETALEGVDYTARVFEEATTYGPAMDPVEVFAAENPEFGVENIIDDVGGSHTYTITLPEEA